MEEFKKKGYYPAGGRSQTSSAGSITYVNTNSGLSAGNVQDAIDEVDGRVDKLEGEFELIEEITIEEAVSLIERTQTPDGKDYNFKGLVIKSQVDSLDTSTDYLTALYNNSTSFNIAAVNGLGLNGTLRYSVMETIITNGFMKSLSVQGSTGDNLIGTMSSYPKSFLLAPYDSISKIVIKPYKSENVINSGVIRIYGLWA